jgi:DNA-binding FadR family transcriptional regulator
MSVSRPHHEAVAEGVSHALLLHDVTVRDVWEALSILEPPLAQVAARTRTTHDLQSISAAAAAFSAERDDREQAVQRVAEFFRALGHATHNPVLGLAQEPLLQLLEPSLRVMIDKIPQAPARIATAQRRLLEALEARDGEAAHAWMTRHIRDFSKGYELAGIKLEMRVTSRPTPLRRRGRP